MHLITFGTSIYSSDSRYSLEYKEPNDWQLHIKYANERDEGHYECQISSHPPLVFIVYLTVVGKLKKFKSSIIKYVIKNSKQLFLLDTKTKNFDKLVRLK